MRINIQALIRFALGLPLNFIYLVACVIPKSKTLWLFSAWNGMKFSDNPKYIYNYLIRNDSEINAIWFTRDHKLFESLRERKLPVIYAMSLAGIWHQLRAGVVVFTHSVNWDFLSPLIGAKATRIQTWHGMPIKKIGFDDMRDRQAHFKIKLYKWLMPYKNERYDLVISGSEIDKSKYVSAFNVSPVNVCVTGYPRNDPIVRSARQSTSDLIKRIIYMPTYRGEIGSEFNLLEKTGFDYVRFDKLLELNRAKFYIKLHPVQVFASADIKTIRRCKNIEPILDDGSDIYEKIGTYDILITDYSGIYFDFLITGKPIIMAPLDIDEYRTNDRELYYEYSDICPDAPRDKWDLVFDRLIGLLKGESIDIKRYRCLQKQFHFYLDDRSSERAANVIKKAAGLKPLGA